MSAGRVDELIRSLELEPHPEGGYYGETWRSDEAWTHLEGAPLELLTIPSAEWRTALPDAGDLL